MIDELEKAAQKAIRDNWHGAAFQELANPETVLKLIAVARAARPLVTGLWHDTDKRVALIQAFQQLESDDD